MAYRKKTLRIMSPVARKLARLIGEQESIARRLKNMLEQIKDLEADVLLVYAAGGPTSLLEAVADCGKPLIIFLRQDSGPYYLWHEIVSARFLRRHTDHVVQTAVDEHDVVVDDSGEILWRLQAS